MTSPIRKKLPTELEQQYAEMKKQSGDSKKKPNWVKNTELNSKMPSDTVTLSSEQLNHDKPKVSQPVSPVEKQALQAQFSIHA